MNQFDPRIKPGAWVVTRHGKAVAVQVSSDGDYVMYRYHSVRMSDGVSMWVANGGLVNDRFARGVTYFREADELSAYVLTLAGDYGVDDEDRQICYESSDYESSDV
jgi:hypothetical protein